MEDEEEPMDEFEWEEWLKKNNEMVDKYSALMDKYMDHPDRDNIIAKEMGQDKDNEDDGIERPWLKEFEESLEHLDDETEEVKDGKPLPVLKRILIYQMLRMIRCINQEFPSPQILLNGLRFYRSGCKTIRI